jgi:hypothetical protein
MSRRRKSQERLPLAGALWAKNLGRDFPGLTMADRAVGLLLTHFADYETGKGARPSQETIAEALGISERTVRGSLKRLEQAGAITCTGRYHRVKVYDLMLCNRNGASAYEEIKAAAMSDVTGSDASGNRNGASANQSEHPDHKGGMDDDRQEIARLRLALPAITEQRMKALTLALPESWEGAALSRSHPALTEAVAELDAAGWTNPQIRQGLSTLGALKSVKNPSAVLAAHLRQMIAAGPSDVVTVPAAPLKPWADPKALKPYSEYLGILPKHLMAICETVTADGYRLEFGSGVYGSGLEEGEPWWNIYIGDPRIPDEYQNECYAGMDEESAFTNGGHLADEYRWDLSREDNPDPLTYSQKVLDELPGHLREAATKVLTWYAENEPLTLVEHLQKQGLAQAVSA